jgi:hypothetical protein
MRIDYSPTRRHRAATDRSLRSVEVGGARRLRKQADVGERLSKLVTAGGMKAAVVTRTVADDDDELAHC